MNSPAQTFMKLSTDEKKKVHIILCEKSLIKWNEYVSNFDEINYTETVCGTNQTVDKNLPSEAINSVKMNIDITNIKDRYSEPIVALQDDDLEFPENIELAYYSIYNLFRKYICCENIEDWLIVNQALSSLDNDKIVKDILLEAISFSKIK
jgi:hypothetical protein